MASNVAGAMLTAQEALERHKIVLDENLRLWQRIEQDHGQDSNVKLIISQGYQDTLAMISTCAELDTKLFSNTKPKLGKAKGKRESSEPDASPTPNSKRRRINDQDVGALSPGAAAHFAPVVDASGLFMIDSNPTNVDVLLSQNQTTQSAEPKKKKRRHSEQQNDNDADVQVDTAEPKSRNKRRRAGTTSKAPEQPESNSEGANQAENGAADEDEAHHQSFEAKVALRLKEKEEQRQKRALKKRKRSSEASTMADENEEQLDEDGYVESSKKVRKPRRKKGKAAKTEEDKSANSKKKKTSRRGSRSKSE